MLIDTHAHLNFNAYKEDSNEVIKRTLEQGVFIINVGSQYSTSRRAVEIAERYNEGVYAAVGLHPIHLASDLVKIIDDKEETEIAGSGEEFNYDNYKKLALRSYSEGGKVVAIGEIGLDYYHKPKSKTKLEEFKEKQKAVFLEQLKLAQELNLPVIFHCRFAHDDLIKILESQKLRGVIHCFTGTWQEAEKYLEMGFYLGFNGIIFKLDLNEIIKKTPLDKILIETDCPYLTPSLPSGALAKEERNEPINIKYIAQKIAEIKNLDYKKVAEATTQNAKKLFRI